MEIRRDVLADHPQYRGLPKEPKPEAKPDVKKTLPPLQWRAPVLLANGDGYAISADNFWSVVKETTKEWGTRYGAFSRTPDFSGSLGWYKDKAQAIAKIESVRTR